MSAIIKFITSCLVVILTSSNLFASDFFNEVDKEYIKLNTFISKITDDTLKKEIDKFYDIAVKASYKSNKAKDVKKMEKIYYKIRRITDNILYTNLPYSASINIEKNWNRLSKSCEEINLCVDYTLRNLSSVKKVREYRSICNEIVNSINDDDLIKKFLNKKLAQSIFGSIPMKRYDNYKYNISQKYTNIQKSDFEKLHIKMSDMRNINDKFTALEYLSDVYFEEFQYQEFSNYKHISIGLLSLTGKPEVSYDQDFILFFRADNAEPSFLMMDKKLWIIKDIKYHFFPKESQNEDDVYFIDIASWDFKDLFECRYKLINRNNEEKEYLSRAVEYMDFYKDFEKKANKSLLPDG